MAVCVMFEVWRWRNHVIYNNKRLDIKHHLMKWFVDINKLLPASRQSSSRCKFLSSQFPFIAVAVVNVSGESFGGAVLSKQGGTEILFGEKFAPADGFTELINVLKIAATKAESLGIRYLVSSNSFMTWLGVEEDEVPWNLLMQRRRFLADFKQIKFCRICPARNSGAIAVAYASSRGEDLSRPSVVVANALNGFQAHVNCFQAPWGNCDFMGRPVVVRDDGWIANRTSRAG